MAIPVGFEITIESIIYKNNSIHLLILLILISLIELKTTINATRLVFTNQALANNHTNTNSNL